MTASRLALIADDRGLAREVQSHLKNTFGREAVLRGLGNGGDLLTRDPEAVLMLATGSPVESDRVMRLVQEIYLQKLPPALFVIEAGTPAPGRGLASIDPYIRHRLRWPDEGQRLLQLLQARAVNAPNLFAAKNETIEDVVARRLLVQTPSLLPLVERIALAAEHDVTVLLTGETGSGKTYLARLLHDCSPRAGQPFLTVPCGALTANLVESTFFGHVKGAFTGAMERKIGKFEAAGNGTILLDEIDTLATEQQAGLLRVIETGEFEPVGSNETKRTNARIIVATNWELEEAVRKGKFRQDLYYRLNVMSFHLPPLRERVRDIAPLARAMAARFNTRFKKDLYDIHARALDVLEGHLWPGNVRQLENTIQQAVLVSVGQELCFEHLPQQVRESVPATPSTLSSPHSLSDNRKALERNVILRALECNSNSRTRAAAALGISRVTLYKKMKKYGLIEPSHNNEE